MTNPIYKNDMWTTPSMKELQDMADRLPSGERAMAYNFMIWTMNMCHESVNKAMEGETV